MGYCSCTPKCKKWTTFGVAIAFLVIGLFCAFLWAIIIHKVLNHQLGISTKSTIGYSMWKETPIPMYLSFYMFNWTNADICEKNASVKPHFTELGPYVFSEHHIRDNVTFNDNATVTFYNRRIWKFAPDKSKGSLSDNVTTFNPVVASVTNVVKDKHYFVQLGVNFFLEEKRVTLAVTRTVNEFIFEGYDDPMLDLLHKLNISNIKIPFTKMGWFVDRNNSAPYDGLFNMNDGADSIDNLGIVRKWNNYEHVPYYPGDCGKVEGTQGELWYPPHEKRSIKIFSNDLCSTLELERNGEDELHGIRGYKYLGTNKAFDNGTLYPEMRCFFNQSEYSGVRDVSLCKYGAPAFVSFPHFYLADPFYRRSIEGMMPDKGKHEMFISLEPNTGLPLKVRAQIQINLRLFHLEHITLVSKMNTTLMPIFWFSQTAELTNDLADTVKMVLILPSAGQYTGYGLLGLGLLLGAIGIFITYRLGWQDSEEEHLLNQNEL